MVFSSHKRHDAGGTGTRGINVRRCRRLAFEPLEGRRMLSVVPVELSGVIINPADLEPERTAVINGTMFFVAEDAANGRELWKTDGTVSGTEMVKNIAPGGASSNPEHLTNVNGTLFFTADDGANGRELWRSNGTEAKTLLVRNISPGSSSSNPEQLTDVNGTLFFTAYEGTHGRELWKSDGIASGTVLVKDINPGGAGSTPLYLTCVNDTVFFSAEEPICGRELWMSDGTAAGTVIAANIAPGSASSNPMNLADLDGTLIFTAEGPTGRKLEALTPVQIVDDGDAGFSTVGNWYHYFGLGFEGDLHYSFKGMGLDVASWNFTVTPGRYQVSATWAPYPNRATNAPYTIYDGTTSLQTVRVNQRATPNDFSDQGAAWETLGTFTIASGTLLVELSDNANGLLIADAVHIERVGDMPPTQIIDDGDRGFSTVGAWYHYFGLGFEGDLHYSFKGTGLDVASWVFTVTPGRYQVAATWAAHPNRATNAPYTVYDGATSLQTVQVNQRAAPNDFSDQGAAWETLGTFDIMNDTLMVTLSDNANGLLIADAVRIEWVGKLPTTQIVDDGDADFSTIGNWYHHFGLGFEDDLHYSFKGAGADVASWSFAVLPGQYQVAVTWAPYPNRATNAPYTVYDGATSLQTVPVNQQATPDSFSDQGAAWETLGSFAVTGNTLLVTLSDNANGLLIADAVRIERTDVLLLAADGEVFPAEEAAALTRPDLQPIVTEAIANWAGAGLAAEQIEALLAVDFLVTDLPGAQIGLATLDAVYLDINAAGHGWFIDPTPGNNEEFKAGDNGELVAVDRETMDRMDLLTVVLHELGHVLGLPDLDPSPGSLMSGTLGTGLRREPGVEEIDALFARL